MARFFAALLAAAAMLQVGSAAPYPYTNGSAPAAPAQSVPRAVNSTVAHEVLKRRLREYPIALSSTQSAFQSDFQVLPVLTISNQPKTTITLSEGMV
ncbi:hypothetical protein Daesc_000337 [Daldinia eschscholtzii]|uniref:Uncharacterized protein n=1 Tax=Daldinia eschscholtzii TaxID=292717 RepID=A0AAX6MY09_9PEZI